METIRLKQFCLVVETGSLSKAAEILHITHSGLSKSLKILQQELGLALLKAQGRGLTTTREGWDFYQKAKIFLQHEQVLFNNQLPKKAEVVIGSAEIFLLPLARHISQLNTQKKIALLEIEFGELEAMLLEEKLHYALTYSPFPQRKIAINCIGQYQIYCYHNNPKFNHMHFSSVPFAVPYRPMQNNYLAIPSRDAWPEHDYPRKQQFAVNSVATAIELMLAGKCAVCLPDFLALHIMQRQAIALHKLPLPDQLIMQQNLFLLTTKSAVHENFTLRLTQLLAPLLNAGK